MIWTLFVPTAVVLALTAVVARASSRVRPAVAAWTLTALLVGSVVALTATGVATVLGSLSHSSWLVERAGLCLRQVHHASGPRLLGPLASGLMAVAVANVVLVSRRHRRATAPLGEEPVLVLPSTAPLAYALPGHPGQVVVTTGMLDALEPDERRVLFAHELAHIRLHHHRFLHLGELAAAAVPLLRPVRRRLAQVVERWADEHAALQVGDRRLVARTIAKAALATEGRPPAGAAAIGVTSGAVPDRVAALLAEPHAGGPGTAAAGVTTGAALAIGGAGVQLHHLATFALGLC